MKYSKEDLLFKIEKLLITLDNVSQTIQRVKDLDICVYYTEFRQILLNELSELFNKYKSL